MSQTNIDYQFVPVPLNLFNCLDNNCRSVLYSLIQLSSHYAKEENQGWFYRSNDDLGAQCNLSKNVMDAALDALYIKGIIDVIPCEKGQGKKQVGKRFKVLFESFKRFEEISIEDSIKNPDYRITTANYKKNRERSFQLKLNSSSISEQTSTLTSLPTSDLTSSQSDNNIYNIENVDNTYNKNNIDELYNYLIINKKTIFEEGSEKFDYQLYSSSTLEFLDKYEKELYNSFKYFNSQEFDGKAKFFELVFSDSSISLENIKELFKYCIRKQMVLERRDKEEHTISPTYEEEPASACTDGSNSKTEATDTPTEDLNDVQSAQLKSIVKRIEGLVRSSLGQGTAENYIDIYNTVVKDYMTLFGCTKKHAEDIICNHYNYVKSELLGAS